MDISLPMVIPIIISLVTLVYTVLQNNKKATRESVEDMDKRLIIAEQHLKECLNERDHYKQDVAQLREENYELMKRLHDREKENI